MATKNLRAVESLLDDEAVVPEDAVLPDLSATQPRPADPTFRFGEDVGEDVGDEGGYYEEVRRQKEHAKEVLATLDTPLDRSVLKYRTGYKNKQLAYLTWQHVVRTLNTLFGYTNWNLAVREITDLGVNPDDGQGGIPHAVRATVQLTIVAPYLAASYENVGYGTVTGARWDAYEMAVKGAVSDAIKRCATALGPQFGLDIADDEEAAAESASAEAPRTERSSAPAAPARRIVEDEAVECDECGNEIRGYTSKAGRTYTTQQLIDYSIKDTGKVLCYKCRTAFKGQQELR